MPLLTQLETSFAQQLQEFPFPIAAILNRLLKAFQLRFGHNMGFGTKNRQKQTADICKQHLREKYRDRLQLVEEFIVEIEGAPKSCDVTRWGQFTDIKDIKKEMLKRLEAHFEKWLNP